MSNLRLSIIIPFYNVEKYIAECLDSVYAQDIPESEYEVICVNDCSPDNSRQIVLDYQRIHPNLILLEHEKNKMLGAARNTGLWAAKGQYVWFIDSDDYIQSKVFSKLLSLAELNDLDILNVNPQYFNDQGFINNEIIVANFPLSTDVITGKEYLKLNVPYWIRPVSTWSKIFKRSFLIENNLLFPEGIFFEDTVHTLKSLLIVSRFKFLCEKLYFYRLNESSIMNTNLHSPVKLADKILYCCDCLNVLEGCKSDIELYNNVSESFIYQLIHCKKTILYFSLDEKKIFYRRLKTLKVQGFEKYLTYKDRYIYQYPILAMTLTFIPFTILSVLRKIKRKLFNS
jgi:glycosyltransferase involved in cell wall biosynthesis